MRQHNESGATPQLSPENIYVFEKARELGAHELSGAVMDPRGLAELVPDFAQARLSIRPLRTTPLFFEARARLQIADHAAAAAQSRQLRRLNQQGGEVAWRPGRTGRRQLVHGICRRRTHLRRRWHRRRHHRGQGTRPSGKPKANFTPGYELRAKVTVLAEGPRGSLTKDLVARKNSMA